METKKYNAKQSMNHWKNQKEIKQYLETKENKNTTIKKLKNLWDTAEVVPREKFLAIQAYVSSQEKSQINNLTLYLKKINKSKYA